MRSETRPQIGAKMNCMSENDVPHLTEAVMSGANEYLLKPFDRDTLAAKFAETGLI